LLAMAVDRSQKHQAPEMLVPRGKYDNPDAALQELTEQRTDIIAYIKDTPTEDLRNHVVDSPSGASDAYQSLLFLAGHTARHTLQSKRVKTSANFPKEEKRGVRTANTPKHDYQKPGCSGSQRKRASIDETAIRYLPANGALISGAGQSG